MSLALSTQVDAVVNTSTAINVPPEGRTYLFGSTGTPPATPIRLVKVAEELIFCQATVCLPPLVTMPLMMVAPNSPVTGVVPAMVCDALNSVVKSLSYRF